MNAMAEYISQVWLTLAELAPWFLFGALVAGLLHGFAPSGFVRRRFSGSQGVVWSVLFGIPLPLCSCAVIPTGIGLRRNGASEGSSVAFLIATPQTGVDSVFVTAAFLGWTFAFYKLAVALILGLGAGWLIEWLGPKRPSQLETGEALQEKSSCCGQQPVRTETSDCCSTGRETVASKSHYPALPQSPSVVVMGNVPARNSSDVPAGVSVSLGRKPESQHPIVALQPTSTADCCSSSKAFGPVTNESCCGGEETTAIQSCCGSEVSKSSKDTPSGFCDYSLQSWFSALSIIRSIYLWVLGGVLISAALNTFVSVDWVTSWMGQSYGLQLLAALMIGIPLYVCATASVPVAAALVGRGLSTGASVVFLLAGPATNVATIGAVRSQFSRFAFWTYLLATIGGSILFAILYDQMFSGFSGRVGHRHEHAYWWNHLSAGVLVGLFLYLAWPRLTKGWRKPDPS